MLVPAGEFQLVLLLVAQGLAYFFFTKLWTGVGVGRALGVVTLRMALGAILFALGGVVSLVVESPLVLVLLVTAPAAWFPCYALVPRARRPKLWLWLIAGTALSLAVNLLFGIDLLTPVKFGRFC